MSKRSAQERIDQVREACEADLSTFIRTMAPYRLLGHVHEDLITWWQRGERAPNDLTLLPRAHQKSALIAFRAAQWLAKHPWESILYTSATAGLAQEQLGIIKDIMTCDAYTRLWPDMVNREEGRRTRWTRDAITVDHPSRKVEGARDPSILAAGVGTSTTGRHAGLVIFDDLVVPENAYTEEGRRTVGAAYAQFASIANPGSEKWVVGTRYHPADLYGRLMDMVAQEFDEDGELVKEFPLYEVFTRIVETEGEFLWPRSRRKDGKWFGFNANILAGIKTEYSLDPTQFYAQYYNDPNDPANQKLDREMFVYYERDNVKRINGSLTANGKKINIAAGVDFAFSTKKGADYSVVAVVGMDSEGYYYILDLFRFKTDRIGEYYKNILKAYNKWDFRKIRMEVSVGQKVIVKDLKENYIQPNGLALSVDEFRPSPHDGSKEQRMNATLLPRYDNQQIYHYRGGNCELLEQEVVATKPEHDDLMDAVTAAIDILKPPPRQQMRQRQDDNVVYDSRFGGVSYK